ncbi:hypothetical protein RDABS01_013736 [Bienertia sinuspersici]
MGKKKNKSTPIPKFNNPASNRDVDSRISFKPDFDCSDDAAELEVPEAPTPIREITASSSSESGSGGAIWDGGATARPRMTSPLSKKTTSDSLDAVKDSGIVKPDATGILNSRGKKLGFVAPIIRNGKPCVQLQHSDINPEVDKWKFAFAFYVVGMNPSLNALKKYAQPWTINFDFNSEVLRVVQVWVRFPSLPLYCWADNSLSRIGSALGVPICTDECTSQQLRISYARMLIEIDVTKPRPLVISVEGPNGVEFEQKVTYEWVPHFCAKCNKVGHDCDHRTSAKKNAKKRKVKPKRIWVEKQQQQFPSIGPCPPSVEFDANSCPAQQQKGIGTEGGCITPTFSKQKQQQQDPGDCNSSDEGNQQQQQGCRDMLMIGMPSTLASGDVGGDEEPDGSDLALYQQQQQRLGTGMTGSARGVSTPSNHVTQQQQHTPNLRKQPSSSEHHKLLNHKQRGGYEALKGARPKKPMLHCPPISMTQDEIESLLYPT